MQVAVGIMGSGEVKCVQANSPQKTRAIAATRAIARSIRFARDRFFSGLRILSSLSQAAGRGVW